MCKHADSADWEDDYAWAYRAKKHGVGLEVMQFRLVITMSLFYRWAEIFDRTVMP